jgi:hypothetical protein
MFGTIYRLDGIEVGDDCDVGTQCTVYFHPKTPDEIKTKCWLSGILRDASRWRRQPNAEQMEHLCSPQKVAELLGNMSDADLEIEVRISCAQKLAARFQDIEAKLRGQVGTAP